MKFHWISPIVLGLVLVVILYVVISYSRERGYYIWYPSQNLFFPIKSKEEVKIVNMAFSNRTEEDLANFMATDKGGVDLFYEILKNNNVSREEIERVFFNKNIIRTIKLYKYIFNRVRPFQLDKSITPPSTDTYFTPSYPAGHVFQYYVVAKYYSKKYPEHYKKLHDLVSRVDSARVKAGIHYPTDGAFSRSLVDDLFDTFGLK